MEKLRFKQDDGTGYPDWEDSTLGDVATWVNGYPFKPSQLGENGIPVVKIKELLDQDNLSVRTPFSEIPPEQTVLPGELLFSWSMTIAARKWRGEKSYVNQHLYKVSPKPGYDQDCILYGLEANLPQIRRLAHGGTAKHITRPELLSYKIAFPSLPEQQKIATFLGLLDERVEAQRVLVSGLEQEKRGYMQAMLSPTPTLRFKQDNGTDYPDWEGTTLGEVATWINGYAFKPADLRDVGVPVIKIREMLDPSQLRVRTPEFDIGEHQKVASGDILFSWSMTIDVRKWRHEDAYVNQHLYKVVPSHDIEPDYLLYSLEAHINSLRKLAHGGTAKHITRPELLRFTISAPSSPEQKKIAQFLGLLDQRLEAEKTKLSALELEKQAFAQRVFL